MTKARVSQLDPKTGNAGKYVRVNGAGTEIILAGLGDTSADAEFIRDTIGAAVVAGSGMTITVNDAGDTITFVSSGGGYTDEQVRDVIGAALVAGTGMTITVNDAGDTITLTIDTTAEAERIRDVMGAALVAGTGMTITVNDAGDTITLASTGGGGGSGGHVIQDEGTPLTARANLNFVGPGVTAADDLANARTTVTIPGGGMGGGGVVGTSTRDPFTATAGQTVFTLSATPTGGFMAFRNGILLQDTVHYTRSGTTLTLADASVVGDAVTAIYGTGAILVTTLPLDTPPGSPHSMDDEFNAGSLDGKWSPITSNSGNEITTSLANSYLFLEPAASGSASTARRVFGIRQPAPAGSFTIAAKLTHDFISDDSRVGLFVAVGGAKAHTYGSNLLAGVGRLAAAMGITTYSESADWSDWDSTAIETAAGVSSPGGFLWYRIRWDAAATTLFFDYSIDGVFWNLAGSRTGMTQPTRCGIAMYSRTAVLQADHRMAVDWFRVTV